MKILFLSDTHTYEQEITCLPEADVICCSGDICMSGEFEEAVGFFRWFSNLPYKHKILTPGNHDICFDASHVKYAKMKKIYQRDNLHKIHGIFDLVPVNVDVLIQSALIIDGVKFWGTPYTPLFGNWAFNVPRKSNKMKSIFSKIPEDVDILLTHGPAKGVLDLNLEGNNEGCEVLKQRLEFIQPPIHNFGHIHESYGSEIIEWESSKKTTLAINSSVVNRRYWTVNNPVLVEYNKETGYKEIVK
jgi:Icc-related predicted phosphoesterase